MTRSSDPARLPDVGLLEHVVDARGLVAPGPVLALGRAWSRVPPGAVVAVLTTDATADRDLPAWCVLRAARYLGRTTHEDSPAHLVLRLR